MISIQCSRKLVADEPPCSIYRYGELIPEPAAFLKQLLIKGSSPSTLRAYAFDLLSFYRFLNSSKLSFADLSQKHALRFISALRDNHAAPRTINRRITVVRSFLNFIRQNMGNEFFASASSGFYKGRRNTALLGPSRLKLPRQAILKVKVPSTLKLPLQTGVVHSFISQLRSYRDRAIVALMLCLGLRSCEIQDLQVPDIDLDNSQIRVWGKGNKERLLPISPWIKSTLVSYLSLERPDISHTTCFVVLKGKRRGFYMLPEGLRKIFRYRRKGSLKDAHPHRFRHTFCTNLIRQKVPLPIVQKLMGHASIDTTLIYINLSLEDVSNEYHRAMAQLEQSNAYETK